MAIRFGAVEQLESSAAAIAAAAHLTVVFIDQSNSPTRGVRQSNGKREISG
jgi:hypothetical protein